ncbi:MAG TPA: hypothetical protein VIP46_02190 [Pyrinomonadaceae bacterium]
MPLKDRIGYGVAAAVLAALCSFSIYFGERPLPSRRSSGVSTMSGVALWLMIPAMASGCLAFLSIIFDHYDRRGNEERYRLFLKWATRTGSTLAGCAYAVDFLIA